MALTGRIRMNDINPQAYLTDVIGRIADHPIQKIDDLLPWRWKPQCTPSSTQTAKTAAISRRLLPNGDGRSM